MKVLHHGRVGHDNRGLSPSLRRHHLHGGGRLVIGVEHGGVLGGGHGGTAEEARGALEGGAGEVAEHAPGGRRLPGGEVRVQRGALGRVGRG